MNVQCANCKTIIFAEVDDFGTAMRCGRCEGVVQIPKKYGSAGVLVGRDFIIGKHLGKGGMGTVHVAYQISLDREVAIKLLHPRFSADRARVEGFIREARTAAKLNHPNIVRALAVGHENTPSGPLYYIAMELVRGNSVMSILRKWHSLPYREALHVGREAAIGLAHAWDTEKLLHRDVKPDNLIMCEDGTVKLADLGLAMPAAEVDLQTDSIDGTPHYICPEYVVGEAMDVRSDIYSLGATLYHMMTGQFVFSGGTGEILEAHVEQAVRPPHELDEHLPLAASKVICKMLEKDPADRFLHPADVAKAIDKVLAELDGKTKAEPEPETSTKSTRRKLIRRGRSAANTRSTKKSAAGDHSMIETVVGLPPQVENQASADARFKLIVLSLVGVAAVLVISMAVLLSGGDKKPAPSGDTMAAVEEEAVAPTTTVDSSETVATTPAFAVADEPVPPASSVAATARVQESAPPSIQLSKAPPQRTRQRPQATAPADAPVPSWVVDAGTRRRAGDPAVVFWEDAARALVAGDSDAAKRAAVTACAQREVLTLIDDLMAIDKVILASFGRRTGVAVTVRLANGVARGTLAGIRDGKVLVKPTAGGATTAIAVDDMHLSERLTRSEKAGEPAASYYRGILALAANRPDVAKQVFGKLDGDLAAACLRLSEQVAGDDSAAANGKGN